MNWDEVCPFSSCPDVEQACHPSLPPMTVNLPSTPLWSLPPSPLSFSSHPLLLSNQYPPSLPPFLLLPHLPPSPLLGTTIHTDVLTVCYMPTWTGHILIQSWSASKWQTLFTLIKLSLQLEDEGKKTNLKWMIVLHFTVSCTNTTNMIS